LGGLVVIHTGLSLAAGLNASGQDELEIDDVFSINNVGAFKRTLIGNKFSGSILPQEAKHIL
jgi:hypothetical protein